MNCKCFLAIVCLFVLVADAQPLKPALALQSGFSFDVNTTFRFSHLNHYLFGQSAVGEFILWDLRNGKQVQKISPLFGTVATVYYKPVAVFSDDERWIMIPDFPRGNYFLYNVRENRIEHTFKPAFPEERYTNAVISADGSRVLLCAQVAGDNPHSRMETRDMDGKLYNDRILSFPLSEVTHDLVGKLLLGKYDRLMKLYPPVQAVTASPDLSKIWFAPTTGGIFSLQVGDAPKRELKTSDFTRIQMPLGSVLFNRLAFYHGKIIAAKDIGIVESKGTNTSLLNDSLFVISETGNLLEKIVPSGFSIFKDTYKYKSLSTGSITTTDDLGTFFKPVSATETTLSFSCLDVVTESRLFDYRTGPRQPPGRQAEYLFGQLTGGALVAISDDRTLVAESASDLIIHDVAEQRISAVFPVFGGYYRLNQPMFLDSNRLLIPKTYADAFVLDLRDGGVERLRQQRNCQDTIVGGHNVFFSIDNTAQIGLENRAMAPDSTSFGLVSYFPNDRCRPGNRKSICLYSTDDLKSKAEYHFEDDEYSWFFSILTSGKFLVNDKLLSFSDSDHYQMKFLRIIERKDTFRCVHPIYLPDRQTIFGIMGTRIKPGNPDLIFGEWNLEGKLVRSFRYHRKKSKMEYQTLILEAKRSPDGKRLLFGLQDGTVGLFEIATMTMGSLYEHGNAIDFKLLGIYNHGSAVAGCFFDNTRFLTAGNDGVVNEWASDASVKARPVNQNPLMMMGMTMAPDGQHVVGIESDKSLVFLNVTSGEIDFRFVAMDYDRYAFVDKDGNYLGSKNASRDLSFFYAGRSFAFSQFDAYLNRPDKIIQELGRASPEVLGYYKMAYQKRISKLGLSGGLAVFDPDQCPKIRLQDLPTSFRETSGDNISFGLNASDPRHLLKRIFILVNGVPLYGVRGLEVAGKKADATVKISIPLSYGKNEVEISAQSASGLESLKENLTVTRTGVASKPNLYILAIGAGKFAHTDKNLQYPSKDAQDVLDMFGTQTSRFGKITAVRLQDQFVTRANVIKQKEIFRQSHPDDYVVVFYAGHGLLDAKLDYYLSTYNTDFANPGANALSYTDLTGLLDSIPARNKLMFLDACNSGELDKESVQAAAEKKTKIGAVAFRGGSPVTVRETRVGLENSFDLMRSLFSDLRKSNGAAVISAARGSEAAAEKEEWKNGGFTYCLKKALMERRADLNADGVIQASELTQYLNQAVNELTDGLQKPTSRSENIANDIVVWR